MRTLLLSLLVATAAAADVFPSDGTTTLVTDSGQKMTWVVKRTDAEVLITGAHPNWQVEHHAKADGTPLVTVKRRDGKTTKVTYTATGAELDRTDARGATSHVTVKESGLWDADSLDVRLAGLTWSKGKKVRFRVLDVDAGDGSTYPMVVEYQEERSCGEAKCHCVRLFVDDFRRLFAPTFDYCYAVEPGARYLRHVGDGFTFTAK